MTILNEIVTYKKTLLNNQYYQKEMEQLEIKDVSHKTSLVNALQSSKLAIIAELKSKSPTVSDIPERDMLTQLKTYTEKGAAAISILTDEKYFGGSYRRLNALALETELPILCKDFVIDKIQIDLAKLAGASIILLIVNILDDAQLKELYNYAYDNGLEVLVEVHDYHELERAHQLNAKIIGINNRDLKTFITNVERTNEVLTPKDNTYYITESGIKTRTDLEKVIHSGIDGALIGEALMRDPSILPNLRLEKQNVY